MHQLPHSRVNQLHLYQFGDLDYTVHMIHKISFTCNIGKLKKLNKEELFIQYRQNLGFNAIPDPNFLILGIPYGETFRNGPTNPRTYYTAIGTHSSVSTYVREESSQYDSRTLPCFCKIHSVRLGKECLSPWSYFLQE